MQPTTDTRPTILVLQDDPAPLTAHVQHRFGADYDVVGIRHTATAADVLTRSTVALVLADLEHEPSTTTTLLTEARQATPATVRALLVPRWSNRAIAEHAGRAVALGIADDIITTPFGHLDVGLYPTISDHLAQWRRATERHGGQPTRVQVIGTSTSQRCHEMRDLLDRNGVSADFIADGTTRADTVLQAAGITSPARPVVVLPDGGVLVDPANAEIAHHLGARTTPDSAQADVVIIGGGPAGLSAAVYAASEGLSTVLVERDAIGGQAGTSSNIRNYLGFPHGITGGDLAARAGEQAWLFGVEFVLTNGVQRLERSAGRWVVGLEDGSSITAGAVVLATGVTYRQLDAPGIRRLHGAGVYYGPAATEAAAMTGHHVHVVGGGNSAGQAALHLSRHAAQTTLLVRGTNLATSMSRYLSDELDRTPNIDVQTSTEVVEAAGRHRLQTLTLRDNVTGATRTATSRGLFILIGAEPTARWLPPDLARDAHGFVLTGAGAAAPRPFETNLPGLFAVGDIRSGSVKRVASAVGEGSVCITDIHNHLAAQDAAQRRTRS